jgi:hypothetical protein
MGMGMATITMTKMWHRYAYPDILHYPYPFLYGYLNALLLKVSTDLIALLNYVSTIARPPLCCLILITLIRLVLPILLILLIVLSPSISILDV